MRSHLLVALVLVVTGFLRAPAFASSAQAIDLPALRTYVEIQAVQFSPDGRHLAIVIRRQNFASNRYDDQLVVMELATRTNRSLTPLSQNLSSPQWSPDGSRIAYMADAGGKNTQVFVVSSRGGVSRRLTGAARGVDGFAWRPDGAAIAFEAPDVPRDQQQIDASRDEFEVGNQEYLSTAKPTPSHLWLQALASGAPRRLTSGSWSVANSELIFPLTEIAPMPFFAWSPDGTSIVFARMATPYIADTVGTVTTVLDVHSGRLRALTSHTRLEAGGLYSSDGKQIAYSYARDGDPLAENEIMLTSAAGGDGEDLTRTLDINVNDALWMSGDRLLVNAFVGTRSRLWVVGMSGDEQRLETGAVDPVPGVITVSRGGAITFAGSEPLRATDVYYMASPQSAPVRLTDYNHTLNARTQSKVESISWQGPDGYAETGVLYYPPRFTPGLKYPLVLQIHGGPTESSIASWRDTDWPGLPQFIAAHGYLVFEPNYRGSDGHGNAYQVAIFNDAGDGPGRDVMAGIEAVKKLGIVDESRMAVSGWSYGGFMTEWLIGRYDVWKAAVAGAAPSDAFVDYSTSDYNVLGRFYFGGSPWDSPALMQAYRDQSPLTYAPHVKTPTLLLSDSFDYRVPAIHSYEYYHALRDNHVTVSFVAYPVAEHWPGDPVRSEDIYRRWVAWLDRYLK
jgi:dipeptidyl aminopeptidase/acylaminoacyl peptidase